MGKIKFLSFVILLATFKVYGQTPPTPVPPPTPYETDTADFLTSTATAEAEIEATSFSGLAAASDADLLGKLSMVSGIVAIEFSKSQRSGCFQLIPNESACVGLAKGAAQAEMMFNRGSQAIMARDGLSGSIYDWSDPGIATLLAGIGVGDPTRESFVTAVTTGSVTDYALVTTNSTTYINTTMTDLETINGMIYDNVAHTLTGPSGEISVAAVDVPPALAERLYSATASIAASHSVVTASIFAKAGVSSGTKAVGTVKYKTPALFKAGASSTDRSPASLPVNYGKTKKAKFLEAISASAKSGLGVKGDNLFHMVSRRFKQKIKSREFILEE